MWYRLLLKHEPNSFETWNHDYCFASYQMIRIKREPLQGHHNGFVSMHSKYSKKCSSTISE